jgi:hypothetical protein
MRRAIMVGFTTVAAIVVLAGPSSALSLKAHTDPRDTQRPPDIRKVWTDRSSHVFFQIATWDHLTHHDVRFNIVLDTRGDNGFDRLIELDAQRAFVSKVNDKGRQGASIGSRRVHGPNERKVWFSIPHRWLDIAIQVKFKVRTGAFNDGSGPWPDRAPDSGRFVGL